MSKALTDSLNGDLICEGLHDEVRKRAMKAKRIDIAVAFWGKGGAKALGLIDAAKRKAKVRILCNANTGGTNPFELEEMQRGGIALKTNGRLHAKVYLIDDWLVIGSANASANGLGLEGSESISWHELSMGTSDGNLVSAARNWFETNWELDESIDVSKPIPEEWKERWQQRRKDGPSPLPDQPQSLFDLVKSSSKKLDDRPKIWLSLISEEDAIDLKEKSDSVREELSVPEDCLTYFWDGAEIGDCFLDFQISTKEKNISFEGIYEFEEHEKGNPHIKINKTSEEMTRCREITAKTKKRFFGCLEFSEREKKIWISLLSKINKEDRDHIMNYGVSVKEFVNMCEKYS